MYTAVFWIRFENTLSYGAGRFQGEKRFNNNRARACRPFAMTQLCLPDDARPMYRIGTRTSRLPRPETFPLQQNVSLLHTLLSVDDFSDGEAPCVSTDSPVFAPVGSQRNVDHESPPDGSPCVRNNDPRGEREPSITMRTPTRPATCPQDARVSVEEIIACRG
ncbi:hypothetical protein M438DRAFT_95729 [Aureobasidium pullulans EXF-150]|uniref:Uncharacterized protein n=1 Tax=Aureobasidium pullulans EXF-150 TaxID=1043002 RepID=A0A074XU27_AURPU|nr:uncharacterized protein M438DRAFT_95729 [Aureobasidium pullulans EXF-150]KEQ89030.1 hypothetical protein M438DRAFT_95729 [Aureobasidium pullulans EXF-150]